MEDDAFMIDYFFKITVFAIFSCCMQLRNAHAILILQTYFLNSFIWAFLFGIFPKLPFRARFLAVLRSGLDSDEVEVLLRAASQKVLQIADETVDVSLARGLHNDLLVVVVPQASAQFLVVHLGLVLANAPTFGDL